ncbi:MAG: hypothetical protein U0793_05685 [Gemmataceae bacterium]
MAAFNLVLLLLTLAIVIVAALSLGYARGDVDQKKTVVGRWLFTGSLVLLGLSAIVAALTRADALAPMGLLSVLLVVGMLWESPAPVRRSEQA